jgi:hypothetical protein
VSNENIEATDIVGNIEDLRETRWVIDELKRLVRDGPDFIDKYELADLVGGNIDLLGRVWRQVERTFIRSHSHPDQAEHHHDCC